RYNADYGAMLLDASDTSIDFKFITRTGQVIDDYTIPTPPPPTTLIPVGSTWRYLDNGSNQGTAWRSVSFDDSAWKSGAAQLGYGDGDAGGCEHRASGAEQPRSDRGRLRHTGESHLDRQRHQRERV